MKPFSFCKYLGCFQLHCCHRYPYGDHLPASVVLHLLNYVLGIQSWKWTVCLLRAGILFGISVECSAARHLEGVVDKWPKGASATC